MKKIQTNTIYQCSFCDFQDTSPKVVGKHEWECRHNTVVAPAEKIKREKRKEIQESSTIKELNDRITEFLITYYSSTATKWSKSSLTFSLSKRYTSDYSLHCSYPSIFEQIAIGTSIQQYPKLKDKLNKFVETTNTYENNRKEFRDARDKAVEEHIYASNDYADYQAKRAALNAEQKQITIKLESLAKEHQKRYDDFCTQFEKDYGYDSKSDELTQLRQDLGI